jgi:glutaredoxin
MKTIKLAFLTTTLKNVMFTSSIIFLSLAITHFYSQNRISNIDLVEVGDYRHLGVSEFTPIVAFTSRKCNACKQFKNDMDKLNLSFKNYDIEYDKEMFHLLKQENINFVPVILVGQTLIKGYNEEVVRDELIKQGYIK